MLKSLYISIVAVMAAFVVFGWWYPSGSDRSYECEQSAKFTYSLFLRSATLLLQGNEYKGALEEGGKLSWGNAPPEATKKLPTSFTRSTGDSRVLLHGGFAGSFVTCALR